MLTLLPCPDLDCDAPAELVDRTVLGSTDGPFPLVKVQCVRGHHFLMPADARLGLPPPVAGSSALTAMTDSP